MARPVKNYCDYFSHDRDMRNHRKIRAIRNKFGISGYAIWCMLLEYLTGNDGNEFEFSDAELELISGDFGVSATEIRQLLDYCLKLEILFLKEGFIHSESLDERLSPVYEKRNESKSKSKKQLRVNGKFAINNTVGNGVSVAEMPQSKVKESKVKESINNSDFDLGTWESEKRLFRNAEEWQMKQCTEFRLSRDCVLELMEEFLKEQDNKEDYKDLKELKRHWYSWYKKNKMSKNNGYSKPELSEYQKEQITKRDLIKGKIES